MARRSGRRSVEPYYRNGGVRVRGYSAKGLATINKAIKHQDQMIKNLRMQIRLKKKEEQLSKKFKRFPDFIRINKS